MRHGRNSFSSPLQVAGRYFRILHNWWRPSPHLYRFRCSIAARRYTARQGPLSEMDCTANGPSGPSPDEAFLRALARGSNQIDLTDPRVDHAATCANCMNRLLAFRRDYQSHRRKLAWVLTGA